MVQLIINLQSQRGLTVTHLWVLTVAASIALWSTLSLTVRLFTTLKRYSGLYFYAILLTSWGISIRQIGILTIYFVPNCPWTIRRILIEMGWVTMVSGFSTVLYSRLSIILKNYRTRRAVLIMIICNAIVWHPMVITTNGGIRYLKNRDMKQKLPSWERVHDVVENIQIVMFCTQEIIISSFYIRAAYQYLHTGFTKTSKARGAMLLLLSVQAIIIAIDIALIVIDIKGYLKLKTLIHSVVYSVKLELEFVTLNQLVELSKMGAPGSPSCHVGMSLCCNVDGAKEKSNKCLSTVVKQIVHCRTSTPDSGVDLESCKTHFCAGGLDFITVPPNHGIR